MNTLLFTTRDRLSLVSKLNPSNASNFFVDQFYTEFALASIGLLVVESEIGSLNAKVLTWEFFFFIQSFPKKISIFTLKTIVFPSMQVCFLCNLPPLSKRADKLSVQERRGHFLVWDSTIENVLNHYLVRMEFSH